MPNERLPSLKIKMKQCALPSIDSIDFIDDNIILLLESIISIKTNADKELLLLRTEYDILFQKNYSLKNQIVTNQSLLEETKKQYKKSIADVVKLNKALIQKEKEYHSTIKTDKAIINELKEKLVRLNNNQGSSYSNSIMTIDSLLTIPQGNKMTSKELFDDMIQSGFQKENNELKIENREIKKLLCDFIEKSISLLYKNHNENISPFINVDRLRRLIELKSEQSKDYLIKAIDEIIELQKESLQWKEELLVLCSVNDNECIRYLFELFEYYKEINSSIITFISDFKKHNCNQLDNKLISRNETSKLEALKELKEIENNNNTNEHAKSVNFLCEKMRCVIKEVQHLTNFFEGYHES